MKNNRLKTIFSIFFFSLVLLPTFVKADSGDDWEFGITIYGWFPDNTGQTSFPVGEGADFEVPIGDILDKLKFTLQGSFDARKGQWGFFSDAIYLDLGDSGSVTNEGSIGGQDWPDDVSADVDFDMKSLIWTNAAYYRAIDQPAKSFDLMAGVRYASVKQSLDWSFNGDINDLPLAGREGGASIKATFWDAVIGLRGQFGLGQQNTWFIPYYLDIGTGDSDFTWQAAGGVGYSFKWGEMAAVWRVLSYDLPTESAISEMEFNGPEVGVVFRW